MTEWTNQQNNGDDAQAAEAQGVAIVGMAGRFPGADDIAAFWRNLRDGVESITFFSDEQLEALGVDPRAIKDPAFVKAGAVVEGLDLFDAAFFGYSPREAELIDPQQRIFLECAWAALESAGYDPRRYPGLIGVYAGMGMSAYLLFNLLSNADILDESDSPLVMLGNDKDFISTRVSYNLNLKGPSLDVQTGCSTSLVAAHIACEHLMSYQCDMALAGGVAAGVPQRTGYLYQEGGIASPDGHCRAFDARAQGSIFGSGAGVVVLKRLADALADGDTIYAVILGSAINNDGAQKVGFTAPSVAGQAEVIARAQAIAGVDPDTISYVEAHGTGTPLGDPMEAQALTNVFRAATERVGYCALGSVKTNIGHLDTAAGAAGLIKTALALQHKQIPPSLHFENPNPQIDFASSPFYVNTKLIDWPADGGPRRAAVSSFGFGGTNAHLILEEAPPQGESSESRAWQILTLSARSAAALDAATDRLAAHLREHPNQPLADIAYTLQVGRALFDHRRALVCRDRDDAAQALEARDPRRVMTRADRAAERPVAFMFAGMGDQYPAMAQELYQSEPIFRAAFDECADLLRPLMGRDLRDLLYPERAQRPDQAAPALDLRAMLASARGPGGAAQSLNQPALAHPALFAVEYALARLLMAWGIQPDALIGHSLGEYVAATIAGVFALDDALDLVARRARMIQDLPGGSMLAVPLPEDELAPLLGSQLQLSAVNGPAVCVVAGSSEAVAALEQQMTARGVACRRLLASHAMHSAMIDPILRPFGDLVATVKLSPPRIPFVSNLSGTWITAAEATDPGYWVRHLRHPVRFADGIRALWGDGERALVEIGPGQALSTLALDYAAGDDARVVVQTLRPSYDRRQTDAAFLLTAVGRLWLAGAQVDWAGFAGDERRIRVPLPTYPFERQRYWIDPRPPGERPAPRQATTAKRTNIADWFYAPSWRRAPALRPFAPADLAERRRWLVFADAGGLADAIVARIEQAGCSVALVAAGPRYERRAPGSYALDPRARAGYDQLFADLKAGECLPDAILHLWSSALADERDPGAARFANAQERGFYSLLWIAQALAALEFAAPLQLWVVAAGLHAIDGADDPAPERATLLGPCKVIPQEYDNISCRCIDIAPDARGRAALIDRVMAEIGAQPPDALIAYRGPWRWVPAFEPLALPADAAPIRPLRERGVYLITGGLGGIGLLLAGYLAETAGARLVLTGRSRIPERAAWDDWLAAHGDDDRVSRAIRRLLALEQRGAEVLALSADAADAAQMRAVVEQAYERFGALHGLIHAAGIAGEQAFRLIPDADAEACAAQFHPKAHGCYAIAEALAGRALDFCLLFSSNTAILGGLGSAAYTSANLFLDAFAQQQSRAGSTPWISANWDGWLLGDAPAGAFQTSIDQYAMAPAESLECFRRIVAGATEAQVVVSTGDLAQRLRIWIERAAGGDQSSALERHPRPLLDAAYVAPRDEIEQTVARVWQELLGIEQVGVHDNFFDLGGHSLLGLKVIARLRGELGVDLPVVSLFEGPTVSALAELIGRDRQDAPAFEESRSRGSGRKEKIRARRRQLAAQEDERA